MSRHGHVLNPGHDGIMVCPESEFLYMEISLGSLKCLDLNEEARLPESLAEGKNNYKEIKLKEMTVGTGKLRHK